MSNPGVIPQSLYQRWNFAVEINGFDVALFTKAQIPKVEFEVVSFAPGGSMFDQKLAGRAKFEDITLEKGVLQDGADEAARDWLRQIINVNNHSGAPASDYMRDIDLVQYNRAGEETRRWTLHGAWPKSLEYDDLDGSSSENMLEKITLCYQYTT